MYKRNIQLYIMRTICIICLLVHVLCFQTACTILSETPRETTNINNTWKYAQGDYTGAEQVDYDDSCWETLVFLILSAYLTLWQKISMWGMGGIGNICNWMKRI